MRSSDFRDSGFRNSRFQRSGCPAQSPLLNAVKPEVPGRVRQAVVAIAPGLAEYSNLNAELKHW